MNNKKCIYNFNNIIKMTMSKNNREDLQSICFSNDGYIIATNSYLLIKIKASDLDMSVKFDDDTNKKIVISSKYLKGKNIKEVSLKDNQNALILLDNDTVLQVPANSPDTFPTVDFLFNPTPEAMEFKTNFIANSSLVAELVACLNAPVIFEPWQNMLAVYEEKRNDLIALLMYIKR